MSNLFYKYYFNDYRYGFNGQEKDNEIKGEGNSLDFGARMDDTRLGRLGMSIDPLANIFPSQSPYIFAGNNPILYIDEEGKKKTVYNVTYDERTGKTTVKIVVSSGLLAQRKSKGDLYGEYDSDYDWYDYSVVNFTRIDKNGNSTTTTSAPIKGEKRTNTEFNMKWWAKFKTGDGDNDAIKQKGSFSGYIYTTKGASGSEYKFNATAAPGSKMVNVDMLTAIFGLSSGNYPNINIQEKFTDLERLLYALQNVNENLGAGEKIGSVAEALKNEFATDKKTDSCEGCGKVGSNRELKEDGYHPKIVPRKKQ